MFGAEFGKQTEIHSLYHKDLLVNYNKSVINTQFLNLGTLGKYCSSSPTMHADKSCEIWF